MIYLLLNIRPSEDSWLHTSGTVEFELTNWDIIRQHLIYAEENLDSDRQVCIRQNK